MTRNSVNKWLSFEKILFSLYYKRNVKTVRAYISIFVAILPNLFMIGIMNTQVNYITQEIFEYEIFWQFLIVNSLSFSPLVSILLAGSIISQDFSKGTAQLIYSSISRKKNLFSNLRFLILHTLLLQLLSFITFSIQGIIVLNKVVPPGLFLVGFVFVYIYSLFYLSFAFVLTSLTRNTVTSLLLPFFYLNFASFFIQMDMGLLAINHYSNTITEVVLIFLWNGAIIMTTDVYLSIFVLLSIPLILLFISIYGFEVVEIRHN
jgi:ABC-type transport system involved in multi-copper enzyme maturation permease subunit